MAEHEKSLDEFKALLKEIEKAEDPTFQRHLKADIFQGYAQDVIKTYVYKNDFDTAMDCLELMLEFENAGKNEPTGAEISRMRALGNMRTTWQNKHFYSEHAVQPSPSPSFTRAFGELGKQLEQVRTLGRNIVSGSAGGLVKYLIWTAALIAALWAIWFAPPVTEFLNANVEEHIFAVLGVVLVAAGRPGAVLPGAGRPVPQVR